MYYALTGRTTRLGECEGMFVCDSNEPSVRRKIAERSSYLDAMDRYACVDLSD
jgi:hypothetical protein